MTNPADVPSRAVPDEEPTLDRTSKMHVKQFAEQVANIASEVYCDGGTRTMSHEIPSSVEVWCENDDDAEFEVLSVEPETMMGCRCWVGIRILVKRTNQPPDPRNAQLENELAALRSESEAVKAEQESASFQNVELRASIEILEDVVKATSEALGEGSYSSIWLHAKAFVAESEALRRDAERYRIIRPQLEIGSERMMIGTVRACLNVRVGCSVLPHVPNPSGWLIGDALDAALDLEVARAVASRLARLAAGNAPRSCY